MTLTKIEGKIYTNVWEVHKEIMQLIQLSNHQDKNAQPLGFYKRQHEMCCKIIIEIKVIKSKYIFQNKGKIMCSKSL